MALTPTQEKKIMTRFLMGAVFLLLLFVVLVVPLDHTGENRSDSISNRALIRLGFRDPPEETKAVVYLGGDVMLGRSVMARSLDEDDFKYPFLGLAPETSDADVFFVNLENAIVENCPKVYENTLKFCGLPKMLEGMNHAKVNVVTLANNHSRNYGEEGFEETKNYLDQYKIDYTGVGNLITKKFNGTTFGFLGFYYVTEEPTEEDFQLVRDSAEKVDILILGLHWGDEYGPADNFSPDPLPAQVEWANKFIQSGADVIAGHHPHYVQRVDYIDGKPVYYSLGNLVFDQMWSEETRTGMLVRLEFHNGELKKEDQFKTYIDNWAQPEIVEE